MTPRISVASLIISLALAVIVLVHSYPSLAQDPKYKAISALLAPGASAETAGTLRVRKQPPYSIGGWFVKGAPIGVLQKGVKVKIVDMYRVPINGGVWYKVQPELDDGSLSAKELGWVFYGGESYLKALSAMKSEKKSSRPEG